MGKLQRDYLAELIPQLARIFVFVFAALFILILFTSGSMARAVLLAALVALPASVVIWFALNRLGNGTVNVLYGLSELELDPVAITDGEITKLMPLKEKKQYTAFLSGLRDVEKKYGQSPRLIYYRAVSHIELGDYEKARNSLSAFFKEHSREEYPEDEFFRFCSYLYREDLPAREARYRETEGQ